VAIWGMATFAAAALVVSLAALPIFAPATVADVLWFGLLGVVAVALSTIAATAALRHRAEAS